MRTSHTTTGLILTALMLGSAATAAAQPAQWTRDGTWTQQDLARDQYQCIREAMMPGGRQPSLGEIANQGLLNGAEIALGKPTTPPAWQTEVAPHPQLFRLCMQARGWRADR